MKKIILLPEIGLDERVTDAAKTMTTSQTISALSPQELRETLNLDRTELTSALHTKKKYKDLSSTQCEDLVNNSPLILAALLVDHGHAHGVVAGAHYTTADVLRAGIHVIGMSQSAKTASSSFVMTMSDGKKFIFSDCAVIAHPTSQQLAEIAIASVQTASIHDIKNPSVAFLSFSTLGSASDESIDKIHEAMKILKNHPNYTGFPFDGEVQFDTAIIPEIAQKKAPESPLAKQPANVLIFPDLNAANITYKAVERLAQAQATGPLLQGFRKPINDLSRGCSVEDIIAMVKVTAKMS